MDTFWLSIGVFLLILIVNLLFTVRMLFITNNGRIAGSIIGFFESLIFALSFAPVLEDIGKWPILLAFCLGSAAGSWVGLLLEKRLMSGFVRVKVVVAFDPTAPQTLASILREAGYGVTEGQGTGGFGQVIVLHSIVARQATDDLIHLIETHRPNAFITVDAAKSVSHGWFSILSNRQTGRA